MTEPKPEPVADRPSPGAARRPTRTWSQRLALAFNLSVSLACIAAAGVIWYANDQLSSRKLVDISSAAEVPETSPGDTASPDATDGAAPTTVAITQPTFPVSVDLEARNYLLTGSDNRSCIDPNSPYAGAFLGEGSDIGERSDTIMLLRVDPVSNQAAVLSFPRDLWVKIADSNRSSRINAAFDTQNPKKLIDTIVLNFWIPVDHYINVDFCAFKDIVDAVGGVGVPFEFAARDKNTGLNIEVPECHVFEGDEALAYVRSRHYQRFNPVSGKWETDGTSDYGRITRQQDFLKRALQKAMDKSKRNPLTAKAIVEAAIKNVVTDKDLTINSILELAGAMQEFDPNTVRTFQVEGRGVKKGNASVIEPTINSETMKQVLAVFRGEAHLADAPTSTTPGDIVTVPPSAVPETTVAPTTTTGSTSTTRPGGATTTVPVTTSSTPEVVVADTEKGFFPPDDPSCR